MVKARKMIREFVLECSVTMSWFFEDESSDYSDLVLDSLSTTTAIVPALWSIEVANCFAVAEKKKRLNALNTTAFQENLNKLSITIDDYLFHKPINNILELARTTKLTTYDACYLELALRKKLPLATLDKELRQSALTKGLQLYLVE